MKKIQLIIAFSLLSFLTSNAQITKGNWMVGGNLGFDYSKIDNKNSNSSGTTIDYTEEGSYNLKIEPNVAYFFKDKFAVGTSISYINGFTEGNKINSDGMNLAINPFVRYYFLKSEKPYNVFLEPSYSRFFSKYLGNNNGFGIKTGFVYFLNSSVAFESIIKYTKISSEQNNLNNIYLGFGFQIHLEKK